MYASRRFSAIEINGSFYSLQNPHSYARWYAETPSDFIFSVKGGRFITHMRKLREVEQPLANFFASGLFNLREKLGPILWQFPPTFKHDRQRFEAFLHLLPKDTSAASRLARKRSRWLNGRVRLSIDANRPLRHAVEVRHESFLDPSFADLLRAHAIALVIAETAGRWPLVHEMSSNFVYIRLHGDKELYRSGYSDTALQRWARRIRCWSIGGQPRDVRTITGNKGPAGATPDIYCFFDNTDAKLRAPVDAGALARLLGGAISPAHSIRYSRSRARTRSATR